MTTKVTPQSADAESSWKFTQDGVVTSSGSSLALHKSWSDTFTGSDNPKWKVQVATHTSATTGAVGLKREFRYGGGELVVANRTYHTATGTPLHVASYSGSGPKLLAPDLSFGSVDPGGISTSAAVLAARVKILQNIQEVNRKFQGGVFLGELSKTLRMIRHPAEALRNGINAYARHAKKRAARERSVRAKNKAIAGTWLEYVYGWKPLINDVRDLSRALSETDSREFIPVSGSGSAKSAGFFSVIKSFDTVGTKSSYSVINSASCLLRGEVGGGPASAKVANMERFGFGSWRQVLPTVWELIPYSFLVDYFTNIGDIIDSYATNVSGVRWVCGTIRQRSEVKLHNVGINYPSLQTGGWVGVFGADTRVLTSQSCSYSGYENTCTRFERSAWGAASLSLSLADFQFRLPGVGSTKWLNIAALWHLRR